MKYFLVSTQGISVYHLFKCIKDSDRHDVRQVISTLSYLSTVELMAEYGIVNEGQLTVLPNPFHEEL